jgi:hypothetical protein
MCENLPRERPNPASEGLMSRTVSFLAVLALAFLTATPAAHAGTSFDFSCDPARPLTVNAGAHATLHPGTYGYVLLKKNPR